MIAFRVVRVICLIIAVGLIMNLFPEEGDKISFIVVALLIWVECMVNEVVWDLMSGPE